MTPKMKQQLLLNIENCSQVLSICLIAISTISVPIFAQQMNFGSDLSGNNVTPPVNTIARGVAKFNLNQENMAYELYVKNIKRVIGAHISLKDGTDLAQVFNPYVEIAGKSGIPTGEVKGQLSKGIITSSDLSGPLFGKNVSDLANLMKNGSAYVVVRTQAHEEGEIQGQVVAK